MIGENLSLIAFDSLLVPQHLIELPLIGDDGALIGLDLSLVPKHGIKLLLVLQQPGLVPENSHLIRNQLSFAHHHSVRHSDRVQRSACGRVYERSPTACNHVEAQAAAARQKDHSQGIPEPYGFFINRFAANYASYGADFLEAVAQTPESMSSAPVLSPMRSTGTPTFSSIAV